MKKAASFVGSCIGDSKGGEGRKITFESRALKNRLRIPGSRTNDGPEQLALVRLRMILDAIHVAGGDAAHNAGR